MPSEWVVDESGEGMWMQRTRKNRFICNRFDINTIQNMSTMALRSDDILLCSYAKSGSHWLWENVRILMSGKNFAEDNIEKDGTMMENFANLDHVPSPRLLNNHAFFDDQPKDLLKGENKLIFLYRNPKDVAVSLYYHQRSLPQFEYKGIFSNFQKRFIQGQVLNSSMFDYLHSWEEGLSSNSSIPHLIVRYEDVHKNPISERRRLATFLGVDYDDAFLQRVAEATKIDRMRQLKSEKSLKDQHGSSFLYRKGVVGDWKNHFTPSESEWFDEAVDKKMGHSKLFQFVYSLE